VRLARLLPKGWPDLLRQIVCFCGAYYAYRLVRGLVVDHPVAAFDHAWTLVHAERSLGVFSEPAISSWAASQPWLERLTGWAYLYSHFVVTTTTLAFVYLLRNASFYFVRNMFVVAMGLALVLYLVYPTAPPRFMPELGFGDPVADVSGVPPSSSGLLVNPYAAIPSMHVAFALMLAGPMAGLVRRTWARTLWLAYPLVVTFVVVATANHFWADAVAGAAVAAVSALAAAALAAWRPEAWALRPLPATGHALADH
jgi:PAP2 superfamily